MSFLYKWRKSSEPPRQVPKVQVELVSVPTSGAKGSSGSKESICVSNSFQELDTTKLPAPGKSEKVLE